MLNQEITEHTCNILYDNKETKETLESILKSLVELGLTQNEAKVYIYLAKSGPKKAIEIAKALRMPRTEIYHLLAKLQSKGLIMLTLQHPIKYVSKPFNETIQILLSSIDEKVKSFRKMQDYLLEQWEELPDIAYDDSGTNTKIQILEGKTSVYAKATEMCKSAKTKLIIVLDEKELLRLYHNDALDSIPTDTNILTNLRIHNMLDGFNGIIIKERLECPLFIIKDYEELLLFLEKNNKNEPVALWTNCKTLVDSLALLFNKLLERT